MPLEADQLLAAVDLEKSQARLLCRLLGLEEPVGELTRLTAGLLLLGDLLMRQGLSFEHTGIILTEIKQPVAAYLAAPEGFWGLQILDGTHAAWPGCPKPFNFREGAYDDRLDPLILTSTSIALTGLLKRVLEPLEGASR